MLKPKTGNKPIVSNTLSVVAASLLDLYMLSKKYHLHVKGPRFYGDHKTYDGIADMSLEWFDTIAEFMRSGGESVPCEPDLVHSQSLVTFPTAVTADQMVDHMDETLEDIIEFMHESYGNSNPTIDSLLQDFEVEISKHHYFIKSSM